MSIDSDIQKGRKSIQNWMDELQRQKERKEAEEILKRRITTQPSSQVQTGNTQVVQPKPKEKSGIGLALLIVGGGIFVFWGIPLLQGKGSVKPGMSKPPGYVPTRTSPLGE